MNLSFDDDTLFYDLYAALLSFVNGKLKVIPEQFSDSKGYTALPPGKRLAVRDALYAHRELLDEFVKENPGRLHHKSRSDKHLLKIGFVPAG